MLELWIGIGVAVGLLLVGQVMWLRARKRRELREYSIEAETLRDLLEPEARVIVYDVRQPLDLLAYSEMIPGARRISPKEIQADPDVIPRDEDVVVYCTCPGE